MSHPDDLFDLIVGICGLVVIVCGSFTVAAICLRIAWECVHGFK